MNDYMRGTIDCCFALASNPAQFISFVHKSTGLTENGIGKNEYIQEKLKEMIGVKK